MRILLELWEYFRVRKKLVLLPIVVALLVLGLLIFVASNAGILSPFVYAM